MGTTILPGPAHEDHPVHRLSSARRAALVVSASLLTSGGLRAGEPVVEVEEVVATCEPPGNGAGPLWCYGAPLLVRQGERVFASAMETGEGVPPLCDTRWRLFRRGDAGWERVAQAEGFREREPCPLAALAPGRLVLSVNPSTEPVGTQYGRCDPHLLLLDVEHAGRAPAAPRPRWEGTPSFTDHSYRGLAVDPARGRVLALNIDARTSEQHWAFGDGEDWKAGSIRFPIRACYPQVAVRDGAAHVLAIGDIVEPNEAWRAYKKEKTGSAWDYVFRRLFYAQAPDLARGGFGEPVEVESVEATGGHITNLDLWLDGDGVAHALYLKTNTSPVLRDRFFPDLAVQTTLEHAEIERGEVARRETLLGGGEGESLTPIYGRFHATADGALHVVFAAQVRAADGAWRLENRLLRIAGGRDDTPPIRLPLEEPLTTFFTAAERGGSEPSDILDLYGTGRDPKALRYARIRLR